MRVVAAVIFHEEKYLACRRAAHKNLAGKWEFPGGKVEQDESDHQALVREIKEELNVLIVVGELVAKSESLVEEKHIEMFSYQVQLVDEKPTSSSDHDLLQWVSKSELSQLNWADLDVPVIESLLRD